jgi:hypothetical protein
VRVGLKVLIKSDYVRVVDFPHQQGFILQGFNIKIPSFLLQLAPIDLFKDFELGYSFDS